MQTFILKTASEVTERGGGGGERNTWKHAGQP